MPLARSRRELDAAGQRAFGVLRPLAARSLTSPPQDLLAELLDAALQITGARAAVLLHDQTGYPQLLVSPRQLGSDARLEEISRQLYTEAFSAGESLQLDLGIEVGGQKLDVAL